MRMSGSQDFKQTHDNTEREEKSMSILNVSGR